MATPDTSEFCISDSSDGALLRWAGRPIEAFHSEIGPALKYLFWQHVIVLAPLCAIAAFLMRGPL